MTSTAGGPTPGARARARIEVTASIKDEARKQLAVGGGAKLSLRAVARELGMVSSALYRYYPSRDDLLTALIVDAYDSIGEAAERAERKASAAEETPARTWVAVCSAVRQWALARPHEYALIYGSPVPGYAAPQDTVGPAARVARVLIGITLEAYEGPGLAVARLPVEARPEAERIAADIVPELPPAAAAVLVGAWAQLFGLVSFEVFGHFHGVVEDRATFFELSVAQLAQDVGLVYPGPR
ncbi:TetR/AcrR family transcriptional regulator [Streptomyces sp. YIM 130001]|uniref:TetR/AcrR family transcriptional regulator n=1 Tax=Streptomyces sp. YIM 130001 TaxID=2259644 RepID=UPI000E650051|nr:TetR/AcrR family transcriptional regulator [Streptomyces sp. YIM 130001]